MLMAAVLLFAIIGVVAVVDIAVVVIAKEIKQNNTSSLDRPDLITMEEDGKHE